MTEFIDVDVRPILRAGGEPFSVIMAALERLEPGEGLRLYAPFKPVPLFDVMASRGFAHREAELEGGEWEIRFMPDDGSIEAAEPPPAAPGDGDWPEPAVHLDNRDLDPPEPMVRILAALERLAPGQTLHALLSREPVFLFRELTKRGHQWRGGFTRQKDAYHLRVRAHA
ncbi:MULTISPECIES: DUF2249 domain-containing protein [Bradyrhizobium]|uniref:DUF2249 domain-containing protein n=1 Tax=Bradyrhizobium TaxID=374 RepID=UPI00293F1E7A|nr:DUF2249 domain-containing protein [Bradyrhizobium sp. NDS-1]WOH75156.1 DUF2249 domain-containing protein [Bradyrhizobium sp. NDS-1]